MVGKMLLKMPFLKNGTEYYTLSEFVTEFNTWIRSDNKTNLWNVIAKNSNEIIHADIVPTTPNTKFNYHMN